MGNHFSKESVYTKVTKTKTLLDIDIHMGMPDFVNKISSYIDDPLTPLLPHCDPSLQCFTVEARGDIGEQQGQDYAESWQQSQEAVGCSAVLVPRLKNRMAEMISTHCSGRFLSLAKKIGGRTVFSIKWM